MSGGHENCERFIKNERYFTKEFDGFVLVTIKNGNQIQISVDGEKPLINDMVMRLFSLILMQSMKDFERK